MSQQILTTKLFIVRPQGNLVAREHLMRKLDEIPARKLTLVSASAGFGKTTAIASWIETHDLPVAWISLDASDNEPISFFSYLVAALRTINPAIGAEIADALDVPNAPTLEQILPPLINDIAAIDGDFLLVLDDYHAIENEKIHEALLFMLERAPASLHIVMTTRVDPPIPLGRSRVRGELLEIRAADLRFNAEDALTFLNDRMRLALSEQHLEALQAKTEGWVAGLQLAALSLQGRSDIEEFIAAFTGADRYVLDYLLEEVLALLPHDLQRKMLELSVLERFNGELCEAVTGSEGGADLLIDLERRNLFLISLDNRREWYRYHHLFGDLLQHRLRQQRPEVLRDLHCRASVWYAKQGMPYQAFHHAWEADDPELLGAVTERFWRDVLNDSGTLRLVDLVERIPEPVRDRSFILRLLVVWGAIYVSNTEGSSEILDEVEADLEGKTDDPDLRELMGHVWLLRAVLIRDLTDSARTVACGEKALALLPDHPVDSPKHVWNASHSMIYLVLGSALSMSGETERAVAMNEQVVQNGKERNSVFTQSVGLSNLCREYVTLGCLTSAYERADELEGWLTFNKVIMFDVVAVPFQVKARVLCERYDLETARAMLDTAIERSSPQRMGQWSELHRIKYQIELTANNLDAAAAALEAMERLDPEGHFRRLGLFSSIQRADYSIRTGNADAAMAWVDAVLADLEMQLIPRTFILTSMEEIVLARVLHNVDRSDEAMARLDAIRVELERRMYRPNLIEAFVLGAEIHSDRGNQDAALESLLEALRIGAPEGFISIFVRGGEPIAKLLAAIQRRGIASSANVPALYLQSVAQACGIPTAGGATMLLPVRSANDVVALTSREREILELMALGYSNRKIADKLYVSINTIKTHIANLFDKLGVRSRVEALIRAREEKLL